MAFHSTLQTSLSSANFSKNAGGTGESTLATTAKEVPGTKRLPAVLGIRDLTVFFLLIVLYLPDINTAQFAGPAAFVYWPLALLTFLLPCMYVTQWLARRFPGQAAPYFWAVRILGNRVSFIAAFCAWWPGLLVAITTIQNMIFSIQYLAPTWFTTPIEQCLLILVGLMVATAIACLPLRWLKHILFGTVLLYLVLYVIIGLAGSWWLWSGHSAAIALYSLSSWQPNSGNFAIFGAIMLGFVGVDVPLFLGGEIRGGKVGAKRTRHYVWWGGLITFLAYVMGTFGIMVIVPSEQAGAFGASMQAISMAFGSNAGNGVAILYAFIQLPVTVVFLLTYSRLLIVMAQDNRLPASLTKVNRHGLPILSIVVQAIIAASMTILLFVLTPALLNNEVKITNLPIDIYNVLSGSLVILWEFSIALLFCSAIGIFYHQKRRIRTLTKSKLFLLGMSIMGMGACVIGIWSTLSSSWIPMLIPNDDWMVIVGGASLLSVVIGWVSSEVPRVRALLREQYRITAHEIETRTRMQELLTEVDRLYREQARAAITDAVTDLPNHRAVMSHIEEEVVRCQTDRCSCAVLFVDLDHFKRVNDTWGHRAGDAILREIGSRLSSNLRTKDFVGRYGGEEFAIVLTDTDLNGAGDTAKRLLAAVNSQPCNWQSDDTQSVIPIEISASIGVAVYQLHGVSREALIEAADGAMYQAKHHGRNQVWIADVEILPAQGTRSTMDGEPVTERIAVKALTAAASAHDREMNDHAQRMMRLAEATAHALNRPEEELHLIRMAALLHDIGKIGVPQTILHKPGPLTDDEWKVMRQHPEIGRQILEQVGGIFHCLAHIVAAHHERWDGQGYPNQLSKEAIPMSARILAVVDSFDAMTSDRPYRAAMPVTEAIAELQRCAGRQYDPIVVTAFLQVLAQEEEQAHLKDSDEIADYSYL